jgi:hypothetical protein
VATRAAVFGFVVHDGDVFLYYLFEGGRLVDEYDSDPGYFRGRLRPPKGGDPRIVLKLCVPGTSEEQVRRLLRERRVAPEQAPAPAVPTENLERARVAMEQYRRQVSETYPQLAERLRQAGRRSRS